MVRRFWDSGGPSREELALAGVWVGAGESGARLLKGGGASRRLRAPSSSGREVHSKQRNSREQHSSSRV